MSPRPRKNSTDVAGLYEKFDRRTGRVYYQYKNPVTGKFHGLGTDKGKAEKIASTANQRIAAAEAEYFMRKIDESPSATKRRGIRLKAWVDRYLKIQDTRLKNGDIAATTHKEKNSNGCIPGFPSGKPPIERTGSKRLCINTG